MELPRVFANPINKKINNTQEVYRADRESSIDVEEYLNNLYKSNRIVYMIPFIININGRIVEDKILSRQGHYLILKNNNKVSIKDIKNIKEKK